jgi:hypothetical protein
MPWASPSLQWLAGFLDAESCLSVKGTSICVRVSNTHLPTLKAIQDRWGGSVLPHGGEEQGWRRSFVWSVHGKEAQTLLETVSGSLREKRLQAEMLLEYRRTGPQDPLRGWIKDALGSLKRVEHPPLVGR